MIWFRNYKSCFFPKFCFWYFFGSLWFNKSNSFLKSGLIACKNAIYCDFVADEINMHKLYQTIFSSFKLFEAEKRCKTNKILLKVEMWLMWKCVQELYSIYLRLREKYTYYFPTKTVTPRGSDLRPRISLDEIRFRIFWIIPGMIIQPV